MATAPRSDPRSETRAEGIARLFPAALDRARLNHPIASEDALREIARQSAGLDWDRECALAHKAARGATLDGMPICEADAAILRRAA